MKMLAVSLLLVALRAAGASLGFSLHVEGQSELRVTLSGPGGELSPGPFRGTIAINGSPSDMPVAGTVRHAEGQWQLPVVVRYAEVPSDWADRFRAGGFAYRLRSAGGGAPREWTGTRSWKEVEVDGGKETLADFLSLDDVRLTHLSLLWSEARAELSVRNPFGFPLKIAQTEYTLVANGREVGAGSTRGMILHASQKNALSLPIEVDHGELLSAAGRALLSGGDVAVRLTGRLVIRLKGGDVVVPLALSGNLTDAS